MCRERVSEETRCGYREGGHLGAVDKGVAGVQRVSVQVG